MLVKLREVAYNGCIFIDLFMPLKLERKLKREADKKGLSGKRKNAYVYGTMNKIEKDKKTKRRILRRKK